MTMSSIEEILKFPAPLYPGMYRTAEQLKEKFLKSEKLMLQHYKARAKYHYEFDGYTLKIANSDYTKVYKLDLSYCYSIIFDSVYESIIFECGTVSNHIIHEVSFMENLEERYMNIDVEPQVELIGCVTR